VSDEGFRAELRARGDRAASETMIGWLRGYTAGARDSG